MKRINRMSSVLGAVGVIALLLGAVPAVSSARGGLEADEYPVKLLGQSVGGQQFILSGWENSCGGWSSFEGTLTGPTDTVLVTPYWESCGLGPVKANGCKLELKPGSENLFGFGPAECGPILNENAYCSSTIPAQGGFSGGFYNKGEGSEAYVHAETKVFGEVEFSQEASFPYCKAETGDNGDYLGEWEMAGVHAETGEPVGIRAVDGFIGFFLSGESFEAEEYPVVIGGGQDEAHQFTPASGAFEFGCEMIDLDGELTSASSTLPLDASHTGCTFSGNNEVTIDMNSCRYELDGDGTMSIVCDEEEDAIVTEAFGPFGTCTVVTGPQDGLDGITLSNFGEGSERGVEVDFEVEGIESTLEGGFFQCGTSGGTYTDGTYTGSTSLLGP